MTPKKTRNMTRWLMSVGLSAIAGAALAQDARTQDVKPASRSKFSGNWQFEAARTVASPEHTSKLQNSLDLGWQGSFSENIKWKLSGRAWYDAAYDDSDFYPAAVERDQKREGRLLENYLDIAMSDWEFRLGRQHIVWGEVVGLFFADVVSAKDLREFVLPEFDRLRIPQWAARAEWFKDDFHFEAVWIPYMSYDLIGKPGADFYPFAPTLLPTGIPAFFRGEEIPSRNIDHTAYGLRANYLINGWDFAGFAYSSMDAQASFRRDLVTTSPAPGIAVLDSIIFTPQHTRIHQTGATLGKDLGEMVVKAEVVYTRDRLYSVTRLDDADGLVKQNTFDAIIGLEWPFAEDSRLNVQWFGRAISNYDSDTLLKKSDNGLTLLLATKIGNWEPEILLIGSLRRDDWLAQPRVTWNFSRNWRAAFGADVFGGERTGFFGRFDNKDRVYSELRYTF